MKTITVKLPPEVDAGLERMAAKMRKTKSVLVRLAIQELLMRPDLVDKLSAYELLSRHCGVVDGLPVDLSISDKYLSGYGK